MKKRLIIILIVITLLVVSFIFFDRYKDNRMSEVLFRVRSTTSLINGRVIQNSASYDGPLKSYDEDLSGVKKIIHKDMNTLVFIYFDNRVDIYVEVNNWLSLYGKSYDIKYFDEEKGVTIYE